MAKPPKKPMMNDDKIYSEEETARRRDAGLRTLLKTPPKPHAEITGKPKPKPNSGKPKSKKKAPAK